MSIWFEFVLTLSLAVGISAIIFLSWSYIFSRQPAKCTFEISPRVANALFVAMFAAYCAVFGSFAILRHETFHSGGYDLGIFDQAIWSTLHGRILENTIMIDSPSLLGHHWSPLLIALVPVYALWNDVRALLIFQTIAIASGGLPLYWFARKRLGYPLALIVSALYFLYPALQNVTLFEFHEIALTIPLLALALFFLLRHRLVPFFICLGLALMLKEEIAFVAAAFGVYLILVERRRLLGSILTIASLVWGYAAVSYVIPYFYGPAYGGNYFFVERYTYLGKTVSEIIHTAVTQPRLVLQQLLLPVKLEFILQLLVPVAFIPLVGIEVFALALPSLAYLLSSDFPSQSSIHYQYTAPLIPFIFFALVIGIGRLAKTRPFSVFSPIRVRALIGILLLCSGIANYYFQSAGPFSQSNEVQAYTPTSHTALGHKLLDMIPPDASVMADSNFVPHLSHRDLVYQTAVVPDLRKIEYLLSDDTLPIHADYESIWRDILPLPFFQTIVAQDGYILKKRAPVTFAQPRSIQFEQGIELLGYTLQSAEPLRRGAPANLILAWQANQAVTGRYAVFVHLRDAAGNLWAQDDREPGLGWFRTDRWQAGDQTLDNYTLTLPAYMPPGQYTLTTGLYRLDNGARLTASTVGGSALGDEPELGVVTVGQDSTPIGVSSVEIAQPKRGRVDDLQLLGSTALPESIASGSALHLGLYWRALNAPSHDYAFDLALLTSDGKIAFEQPGSADVIYPAAQWIKDEIILQYHTLNLDPAFAPGAYQLAVLVRNGSGADAKKLILGPVTVEHTEHQYTAPVVSHSLQADFGNAIRLVGYDAASNSDTFSLTLYWQSLAPVSTSYTVFVHLLDDQNKIIAQQDQIPVGGNYPTTRWLKSEYIKEAYSLTLPAGAHPTQIEIGLYDAATGKRLTRSDGTDHLLLPLK